MSTIAIIQARLGSIRFPRKMLADLCGKSVVRHVVERVLQVKGVDRVVLAVPWGDQGEIAKAVDNVEREISVFQARVEDADVLGRFAAVLDSPAYADVDVILRVTGDSPLIDPLVCERALELYHASKAEYVWNVTTDNGGPWPDGLNVEVFSRRVLELSNRHTVDAEKREHVTADIRERVRVVELPMDPAYADWPKVSIDEPDDLERVRLFVAGQILDKAHAEERKLTSTEAAEFDACITGPEGFDA